MMTNDRLLFEVAEGLERANTVAQAAWGEQTLSLTNARQLTAACRKALNAAVELETRAAAPNPNSEDRGPKEGRNPKAES